MSVRIVKEAAFSDPTPAWLPATWSWTDTDPLAVRLTVTPYGQPVRSWTLARSLLAEVLAEGFAGDGDALGWVKDHLLTLWLRSGGEQERLQGAAEIAALFLIATNAVVAQCVCLSAGPDFCRECAVVARSLDDALAGIEAA